MSLPSIHQRTSESGSIAAASVSPSSSSSSSSVEAKTARAPRAVHNNSNSSSSSSSNNSARAPLGRMKKPNNESKSPARPAFPYSLPNKRTASGGGGRDSSSSARKTQQVRSQSNNKTKSEAELTKNRLKDFNSELSDFISVMRRKFGSDFPQDLKEAITQHPVSTKLLEALQHQLPSVADSSSSSSPLTSAVAAAEAVVVTSPSPVNPSTSSSLSTSSVLPNFASSSTSLSPHPPPSQPQPQFQQKPEQQQQEEHDVLVTSPSSSGIGMMGAPETSANTPFDSSSSNASTAMPNSNTNNNSDTSSVLPLQGVLSKKKSNLSSASNSSAPQSQQMRKGISFSSGKGNNNNNNNSNNNNSNNNNMLNVNSSGGGVVGDSRSTASFDDGILNNFVSRLTLEHFTASSPASGVNSSSRLGGVVDITEPRHIECAVCFIDISGYSKIVTALSKEGPFAVSRAVNGYLEKLLEVVAKHRLDVQNFAGDAMTVICKVQDPASLLVRQQNKSNNNNVKNDNNNSSNKAPNRRQLHLARLQALANAVTRVAVCAHELQVTRGVHKVPGTEFEFKIHVALSVGKATSVVYHNPSIRNMQQAYATFSGPALLDVGALIDLAKSGETAVSNNAAELLRWQAARLKRAAEKQGTAFRGGLLNLELETVIIPTCAKKETSPTSASIQQEAAKSDPSSATVTSASNTAECGGSCSVILLRQAVIKRVHHPNANKLSNRTTSTNSGSGSGNRLKGNNNNNNNNSNNSLSKTTNSSSSNNTSTELTVTPTTEAAAGETFLPAFGESTSPTTTTNSTNTMFSSGWLDSSDLNVSDDNFTNSSEGDELESEGSDSSDEDEDRETEEEEEEEEYEEEDLDEDLAGEAVRVSQDKLVHPAVIRKIKTSARATHVAELRFATVLFISRRVPKDELALQLFEEEELDRRESEFATASNVSGAGSDAQFSSRDGSFYNKKVAAVQASQAEQRKQKEKEEKEEEEEEERKEAKEAEEEGAIPEPNLVFSSHGDVQDSSHIFTVNFLNEVQEVLDNNNSSIIQILQDEKGFTCIAVVGLFVADPQSASTAIQIAQELEARGVPANIGVASGGLFAGILGSTSHAARFDIAGSVVVKSARMMQHAIKQNLYMVTDESVAKVANDRSVLTSLGSIPVKGSPDPVPIFTATSFDPRLLEYLIPSVRGCMDVNKKAIDKVVHYLGSSLKHKVHGVVVHSSVGSGKTTMIVNALWLYCAKKCGLQETLESGDVTLVSEKKKIQNDFSFITTVLKCDSASGGGSPSSSSGNSKAGGCNFELAYFLAQVAKNTFHTLPVEILDEVHVISDRILESLQLRHILRAQTLSVALCRKLISAGVRLCVIIRNASSLDDSSRSLLNHLFHLAEDIQPQEEKQEYASRVHSTASFISKKKQQEHQQQQSSSPTSASGASSSSSTTPPPPVSESSFRTKSFRRHASRTKQATSSSSALLQQQEEQQKQGKILFFLNVTPTFGQNTWKELARKLPAAKSTTVGLDSMTKEECAALIEYEVGWRPLPTFTSTVLEKSAGNVATAATMIRSVVTSKPPFEKVMLRIDRAGCWIDHTSNNLFDRVSWTFTNPQLSAKVLQQYDCLAALPRLQLILKVLAEATCHRLLGCALSTLQEVVCLMLRRSRTHETAAEINRDLALLKELELIRESKHENEHAKKAQKDAETCVTSKKGKGKNNNINKQEVEGGKEEEQKKPGEGECCEEEQGVKEAMQKLKEFEEKQQEQKEGEGDGCCGIPLPPRGRAEEVEEEEKAALAERAKKRQEAEELLARASTSPVSSPAASNKDSSLSLADLSSTAASGSSSSFSAVPIVAPDFKEDDHTRSFYIANPALHDVLLSLTPPEQQQEIAAALAKYFSPLITCKVYFSLIKGYYYARSGDRKEAEAFLKDSWIKWKWLKKYILKNELSFTNTDEVSTQLTRYTRTYRYCFFEVFRCKDESEFPSWYDEAQEFQENSCALSQSIVRKVLVPLARVEIPISFGFVSFELEEVCKEVSRLAFRARARERLQMGHLNFIRLFSMLFLYIVKFVQRDLLKNKLEEDQEYLAVQQGFLPILKSFVAPEAAFFTVGFKCQDPPAGLFQAEMEKKMFMQYAASQSDLTEEEYLAFSAQFWSKAAERLLKFVESEAFVKLGALWKYEFGHGDPDRCRRLRVPVNPAMSDETMRLLLQKSFSQVNGARHVETAEEYIEQMRAIDKKFDVGGRNEQAVRKVVRSMEDSKSALLDRRFIEKNCMLRALTPLASLNSPMKISPAELHERLLKRQTEDIESITACLFLSLSFPSPPVETPEQASKTFMEILREM